MEDTPHGDGSTNQREGPQSGHSRSQRPRAEIAHQATESTDHVRPHQCLNHAATRPRPHPRKSALVESPEGPIPRRLCVQATVRVQVRSHDRCACATWQLLPTSTRSHTGPSDPQTRHESRIQPVQPYSRVRPAARTRSAGRIVHGVAERQALDGRPVQVRSGETLGCPGFPGSEASAYCWHAPSFVGAASALPGVSLMRLPQLHRAAATAQR